MQHDSLHVICLWRALIEQVNCKSNEKNNTNSINFFLLVNYEQNKQETYLNITRTISAKNDPGTLSTRLWPTSHKVFSTQAVPLWPFLEMFNQKLMISKIIIYFGKAKSLQKKVKWYSSQVMLSSAWSNRNVFFLINREVHINVALGHLLQ